MYPVTKISLSEKIGKGYNQFWHFKGRYLLVKGSRGSKKSTTAAMKIIYLMMKYPLSNCLVVRQVFNTQRDSTWKQLQWATETLGVSHLWKFTVSPLEATFQPTGQKIYFRGCDNPLSITSITAPVGFLNLCWI
jgi:phage terminase large subunit